MQAIANIDAGGADLHTQGAIDTVTQPQGFGIRFAFTRTTGITAFFIIGDDQGVLIKHGALKARIGTHINADLFAQKARISIGREAVKNNPERLPGSQVQGHD